MKTFKTLADMAALVGQEVAVSDWITITQEQVNQFAEATGDHQWIHVDVERAKKGPFGAPIAHGYLTLSLLPKFFDSALRVEQVGMGVNYGLNRVRCNRPRRLGEHGIERRVGGQFHVTRFGQHGAGGVGDGDGRLEGRRLRGGEPRLDGDGVTHRERRVLRVGSHAGRQALDGITWACATVMTPRDFGPPTHAPREHFAALAPQGHRVALVFGSERFGMANEDVYRCHACLSIPTHPDYGSLNLAQAVQLLAYEWRQALGGFAVAPRTVEPQWADGAAVQGLLAHWQQALVQIGFLDPAAPKKLMPRLNQLANRAQLTAEEVHILRGIARAVQKQWPAAE